MSDLTFSYPASEPTTEAEYRTVMQLLRTEMDALNQQMESDRKDIEQLKTESDLLKVETRAMLATLGVAV